MTCPRALWRVTLGSGRNPAIFSRRDGADDEGTRRVTEGDGEEDHLVGGGGNHRGDGPDDAAVEGADGGRGLCGTGGPAQGKSDRAAGSGSHGGGGVAAVPGRVLRP